ncbi:Oidioi.mRNA.OKI2018_I69.PAR.g8471.t1.cds [Oikopleura dioica]|uniref:Oidioi.mRNA.OKI2018_I69.PAR.g8471.t1.cds n=1 Tax=Oikopleura dioica TaxID=34765 RepID=A0ABN7RG38_OIKDI|nr:Oidioi.mRNA.OKI2018_I69.PAR.g8471.t1.cds [Oikopleura dioica]
MKLKLETIKSAIEKLQNSNLSTVNELRKEIASLDERIRKRKAEKSEELETAQKELVTKTMILQKRNENIQEQNRRKIDEQKQLQKKFLEDKEEILAKINSLNQKARNRAKEPVFKI